MESLVNNIICCIINIQQIFVIDFIIHMHLD